jgi:hypothetical protein
MCECTLKPIPAVNDFGLAVEVRSARNVIPEQSESYTVSPSAAN